MGEPRRLTQSKLNISFCNQKLLNGKDLNGTFDVDDFATAFVRTSGPTIAMNISWAQNIGEGESYIDFLGTKGGVRLQYGSDFKFYTTKDGKLWNEKPAFTPNNMFNDEIAGFVRCVRSGEKLPSHIDQFVITSKMMQAMYDSSEMDKEIDLR